MTQSCLQNQYTSHAVAYFMLKIRPTLFEVDLENRRHSVLEIETFLFSFLGWWRPEKGNSKRGFNEPSSDKQNVHTISSLLSAVDTWHNNLTRWHEGLPGLMQVLFPTILCGKKKSLTFIIFGFCVCITFYAYVNKRSLVLCTHLYLNYRFYFLQYNLNPIFLFLKLW